MKTFDYVILSEYNEWLSTGKKETEKQLQTELNRLKKEDNRRELVVFKCNEFETYHY
jgi:hypothetical protein